MTDPSPNQPNQPFQQGLRLRRFLLAATTYALGLLILALCTAFGLLRGTELAWIGLMFGVINLVFFVLFRSGWNTRFTDPSLTLAQVCVAISAVSLILVLGERAHLVAVPFYSSIFVFAMLRLTPREVLAVELFMLLTYGAAIALRWWRYAGALDLHIEAINAALVILSSLWYAMAAGYISSLRARLRESRQTIEALATRDAMTETWNRRHIDALLATELQRKARIGGMLCVGLVDLDHFKSINDRFGHPAGDSVLKQVAQTMKGQLRSVDQLGRFGGEEFLLLLPGVSLPEARVCCERLLGSIARLSPLADPQERVTASIGLAETVAGESPEALVARVDAALYQAKRDGRNRVVVVLPGPRPAPGA